MIRLEWPVFWWFVGTCVSRGVGPVEETTRIRFKWSISWWFNQSCVSCVVSPGKQPPDFSRLWHRASIRGTAATAALPHHGQISIPPSDSTVCHSFNCPTRSIPLSTDRKLLPHPRPESPINLTNTIPTAMPAINTNNTTLKSYQSINPSTTTTNTDSPTDSTGTIIFGVLASVLALVAIIIGILQLRKTKAHRQTDGSA